MYKNSHKATVFEQEELRLPNGDYRPDAPAKLHEFWLRLGLYMEFEPTGIGNVMLVRHICCVEDVS